MGGGVGGVRRESGRGEEGKWGGVRRYIGGVSGEG